MGRTLFTKLQNASDTISELKTEFFLTLLYAPLPPTAIVQYSIHYHIAILFSSYVIFVLAQRDALSLPGLVCLYVEVLVWESRCYHTPAQHWHVA